MTLVPFYLSTTRTLMNKMNLSIIIKTPLLQNKVILWQHTPFPCAFIAIREKREWTLNKWQQLISFFVRYFYSSFILINWMVVFKTVIDRTNFERDRMQLDCTWNLIFYCYMKSCVFTEISFCILRWVQGKNSTFNLMLI